MFKKIHSKRDPNATVLSELTKEFAVYFSKAGRLGSIVIGKYPRFIFGVMIFLMAVSIGLSLTVFRQAGSFVNTKAPPKTAGKPVNDGFSEILEAGSKLRETILLKRQVDSITAKKTLDKSDSAALLRDLDRLNQINQPINKLRK